MSKRCLVSLQIISRSITLWWYCRSEFERSTDVRLQSPLTTPSLARPSATNERTNANARARAPHATSAAALIPDPICGVKLLPYMGLLSLSLSLSLSLVH